MKKLLLWVLILCLALVGCQGSNTSNESTNSVDSTTSEASGSSAESVPQDATVTLNGITNTLDVNIANYTNTSSIMYHVLSNLFDFDDTFAMVPDAINEWEQVNPTTFKLIINTDYKFHNGDPMTVEDVQFSILRLRDIPQTASTVENIEDVKIVDDKTLELITIEPKNNTLRSIATTVVVSKKLLEEQGEKFWENPIGTGPFEFVSFTPGQEVVLKRWEDYPFEKTKLDTITFKNIEDPTSLYIALETGETDFINTIQYLDHDRANSNKDITTDQILTVRTAFVAMNASKAPFDNELVRRAVAHATDKESMALLAGDATVIDSMIPSFIDGYYSSDNTPEYNLDKAKALLAEAGYADGLTIVCSAYSSDTSRIELLQADLKKIGITMEIEILEFGVFLDKVLGADYDILFGSWGNLNGDVTSMLDCYTEASLAESNISFYIDPEIDRLIKIAEETVDPEEKLEMVKQIQDMAAKAMSMIPTTTGVTTYGMNKHLKGVYYHPSGIIDFSDAYFE